MIYYIAGLIPKVSEEVATENAENCRRRQPHWPTVAWRHLPANIQIS